MFVSPERKIKFSHERNNFIPNTKEFANVCSIDHRRDRTLRVEDRSIAKRNETRYQNVYSRNHVPSRLIAIIIAAVTMTIASHQ